MYDQAKYLIHADITADGVVERNDVVGAVFGQTEGLLGEDLDLRDLQESQKLGRIDVEITSEGGQSFGEITIASGLDRVETAILAAALETIERVGPCRATVEVTDLEDVRSAKRREVVERATQLLAEFDESSLSSQDIVEEVREAVRVADITEFHGFPAGPRVGESDAVIVVEGRADVLALLRCGVKNPIAVEGTDIPEKVAQLTCERTVTAFLDGDRGGGLILKELAQVGDIDHVALAPPGRSVEDLSRDEVMTALREKVPFEAVDEADPAAVAAATDGSVRPAPDAERADADADEDDAAAAEPTRSGSATEEPTTEESAIEESATTGGETDDEETDEGGDPTTLPEHVAAVIGGDTGQVRLLDDAFGVLAEGAAEEAFELLDDAGAVPAAVVLDGELTQRVLDVAAQRGVPQVVAASEGEYVKQPTAVRVRTAAELQTAV
jgi:DNA primase